MDLLRGLIAEYPDEPSYQLFMAHTERDLANTLQSTFDRRAEAEEMLCQAATIHGTLVEKYPESEQYLLEQARYFHESGYFHYIAAQSDEAERDYRRALKIFQRVEKQFPHETNCQTEQAFVHNSLGVLYRSNWQLAEAEQAHRSALQLLESQHGGQTDLRASERLRSLGRLAMLLWSRGEQLEAERYLRRSWPQQRRPFRNILTLPGHARSSVYFSGTLEGCRKQWADLKKPRSYTAVPRKTKITWLPKLLILPNFNWTRR